MSRNLSRTSCRECPGLHEHIVFDEAPRPVTAADVGEHYFPEYTGLVVAKAHCVLCHALYIAWVRWPRSRWGGDQEPFEGRRFFDLSYQHAFNDEPSVEDTPLFAVEAVVTYKRRPLEPGEHRYQEIRRSYNRPEWLAETEAAIARWTARRDAFVAEALSPADELAKRGNHG